MTAAELMEQGIRAYTRGQLGEAERCWRDVLALEPANERALSYLELLVGKLTRAAATEPAQAAPVPLPAPARASSATAPSEPAAPARAAGPVPLPAPGGPSPSGRPSPTRGESDGIPEPDDSAWMRPPITIPPTRDPFAPVEPHPSRSAAEGWGELSAVQAVPSTASPIGWDGASQGTTPSWTDEELWSPGSPTPGPAVAEVRIDPLAFDDDVTAPLPTNPSPGVEPRTTLSDYAPSPWDEGPTLTPAVVLEDGVGLDLASVAEQSDLRPLVPEAREDAAQAPPPRARSEVEIWMDGARELFALGDFSGSLEMIEKILKVDPSHAEAREYLQQNEATLIAMYESKLGPARGIPRLAIQPEEVMWLNLDHRAGFLLAQIDGTVSYDDLFALSGLPRLDTARILAALLQEGVIRS